MDVPLPTADELLSQLAEAIESPYTDVQHADKRVRYRSMAEIRDSLSLADEVVNGQQKRVVARPGRPRL